MCPAWGCLEMKGLGARSPPGPAEPDRARTAGNTAAASRALLRDHPVVRMTWRCGTTAFSIPVAMSVMDARGRVPRLARRVGMLTPGRIRSWKRSRRLARNRCCRCALVAERGPKTFQRYPYDPEPFAAVLRRRAALLKQAYSAGTGSSVAS